MKLFLIKMNQIKSLFNAFTNMLPSSASTHLSATLVHTNSAAVMPQNDFIVASANHQEESDPTVIVEIEIKNSMDTLLRKEENDIENQLGVIALPSENNNKRLGSVQRLSECKKGLCSVFQLFGVVKRLNEREIDDIEKQLGVLVLPSKNKEKKFETDQRLCETIKGFCVECQMLGDFDKFRESLECFCGGVKFVTTLSMFLVGWQGGEWGWVFQLWGIIEVMSECMESFCGGVKFILDVSKRDGEWKFG